MSPAVPLTLIIVQVLFASLAIAGRYVLPEFPAGLLVTVRVLGAAAVLLAVNALRGGPWVTNRRDLLSLAVLGTLGIAANQSLFLFGLQHTTAINATILVTTVPVFTVFGSVLLGREPASGWKFAGIALAALGTIYLIGPDRISLAPDVALGNLLIVIGMLCYAAYFLLAKPMMSRYDSITVSTYVMLFAIVGVLPLGAAGAQGLRRGRRARPGVGLGRVHRGGPDDLHLPAQHLGAQARLVEHGGDLHLPAAAAHGGSGAAAASGRVAHGARGRPRHAPSSPAWPR